MSQSVLARACVRGSIRADQVPKMSTTNTDDHTTLALSVRARMARMRRDPRIQDYCYFTARTNLAALRSAISSLGGSLHSVLDVGCGKKPFGPLFSETIRHVGMDIACDTDADVVHDLETKWPMEDGSFDLVLMSEVMEHLGDPEHALAESARVLRPGGLLYISTPFAFPLHARPHDFLRFTEFFYKRIPERHPFALQSLDTSNSALVTPVLQTELLLLSAPFVPFALKQAAWAVGNICISVVERLVGGKRECEGRLASFLRSNPCGYAVVLRRNDS